MYVIWYFRCHFARKFISKKRNCKSWFKKTMGFLIPPHPLTNFELEKILSK